MLDGMNDLTTGPGNGALSIPDFQATEVMTPVELRPVEARVISAWSKNSKIASLHESGHVTVSALLGLPMKAASVEGVNGAGGHVELGLGSDEEIGYYTGSQLADLVCAQLGGYAGEVVMLGAATSGCSQDLTDATGTAHRRTQAGLDPTAPFISEAGLGWGGTPEALKTALLNSIQTAMAEQRDRAIHLISTHQAETYKFAEILFQQRRLDTDRLDAALEAAGLPVRPRV